MKIREFLHTNEGQATVELAILFPVIIIIAVIAVNALTFFTYCSDFDRSFKQEVSFIASNPGYGQSVSSTKSIIQSDLIEKFDNDYLEFEISVENVSGNFQAFNGKLKMHPTLFGMGLRSEIFGVALPTLNHQQKLVVEQYKPGVIF